MSEPERGEGGTRRTYIAKSMDEFFTMREILDFLKTQADARTPNPYRQGVTMRLILRQALRSKGRDQ
jgi:hypothetical protein